MADEVNQANVWLADVTYREGWTFEIGFGGGPMKAGVDPKHPRFLRPPAMFPPGLWLRIVAAVVDSNLGTPKWINHRRPIDPEYLVDRETLLNEVLRQTVEIETHEAMEFFRYRGERVDNSHSAPMQTAPNGVHYRLTKDTGR